MHEFNVSSGPGVNDIIYIKAGTYTGEGINLKDGQTLLGDDQALSLPDPFGGPAIVLETSSGARPTIHVTTAGDQAIDLGQNNTIHGINIVTDAGTIGLDDGQGAGGNAVGTLTVDQMTISGAGQAVDIDQGGALNVALESVTSTGGAEGIQLGAHRVERRRHCCPARSRAATAPSAARPPRASWSATAPAAPTPAARRRSPTAAPSPLRTRPPSSISRITRPERSRSPAT